MEIRINVDDNFMESLKDRLNEKRATDVTKDALTLLNWAVSEIENGRVILSAQRDGTDMHRLAMPALNKVTK
ncbi:hypothetical protein [Nitrosomonas sp. Nm166]|uniref:hypothetical protein n=1 Tax=Nitrosomonas sp. Nm166 TaxID=1881054 RepID=UPI0008E89132|nr:hypothetical protein [Nitrosomonas sp. Nm166]SFD94384.1 hypothetical protein SAMN05428977_100326 [Nitrosomonas sp. Nm166]